eukprot:scaffold97650_cov58-Cyclotella_meneghiniana.AAC.1
MKTLGLLGALLSSWAVSIYADEVPLDEMKACATVVLCLKLHTLCNGVGLGFFFLCVTSTLAIILDLSGVPQAVHKGSWTALCSMK